MTCPKCNDEGFINRHANLPDEPCPACSSSPVPPAAEPFIWICLVSATDDADPDPRIRAWTANGARAAQLAEQGLDMVPVYRDPPARSCAGNADVLLPIKVLVGACENNGGLVKFPSGRELILSKADASALVSVESRVLSTDRLIDAVQLLIDYIGDGCPDGTYSYCMSEAKAAIKGIRVIGAQPQGVRTSAAKWREQGLPDPHMTRYDCERGHLMMGNLTDDEMANAVFLNNSDIATLTAAKDRIRWLSRQLEAALERDRQADAASQVSRPKSQ